MGFTLQVSNRVESESIVWTRLLYIIWLIGLENSSLSQYPGLMDVVFFFLFRSPPYIHCTWSLGILGIKESKLILSIALWEHPERSMQQRRF